MNTQNVIIMQVLPQKFFFTQHVILFLFAHHEPKLLNLNFFTNWRFLSLL